jgi:hypothetical protein
VIVESKRTLRLRTVVVLLILAVPIVYAAFLYLSYLDVTTTSGSAYGYTIGQTRADAYRVAQAQFRGGDIEAIDTLRNREVEIEHFPGIVGGAARHKISEVRDSFERWDQWALWLEGETHDPLAILKFHGDRLHDLDLSQPGHPDDLGLRVGQSYAEVYSALESLAALPEYASLVVDTGWMARRQPVSFGDSEYRLVAEQDEWTLLVNGSYLNTIRLSFHDGRLVRIYRRRQYFELP